MYSGFVNVYNKYDVHRLLSINTNPSAYKFIHAKNLNGSQTYAEKNG